MRATRIVLLSTTLATLIAATATATATAKPSRAAEPTPAPPKPAAAGELNAAQARALFARAIEALGGKEKIAQVRDVRTRGQVTAKTPSGELTMSMESTMVFPDRLAQQVDGPYGRFAMIATPAGAYVLTDQGPKDLPNPMRDELLRQVQRTAYYLAQKADDPKLTVTPGGEEKIGEVATRALDVAYGDVAVRWFVDPATGRILRAAHDSISPAGKKLRIVSNFSDFKTVDGFTLPYRFEVATEGEPDQTVVLEEVKINPGFDPKLFDKSAAPIPSPTPTATSTAKPGA